MTEREMRAVDQTALWHPFTQMEGYADELPAPPIIERAEGNWLIDIHGNRFLDANCGYWCLALGCRPNAVENAIREQLQKFSHSTLLGLSHVPAIELAKKLTGLAGAPLNHVFFADSGSEAVEAALKMSYQYWCHKGQPERSEFLALGQAYHGDTLGAVAAGGIDVFHAAFKPLLFPVRRVPAPAGGPECAVVIEREIEAHCKTLAAVVIEPFVLGPGGVIAQPEGYVERVLLAAKKFNVLAIFDEVAVGMGRLGTLFAFEQLKTEMRPDIVCLAKGLTGGLLPLSAVLAAEHVYAAFLGKFSERRTFFHGHTFTGSALGCAAALAALDELSRPGFLERVRLETIPHFWRVLENLRGHPKVRCVRGRGMMAGVEVARSENSEYAWEEQAGHRAVLAARARGVQTRAIGNVVLAVPPLTILPDEIELLGRVLRESLDELE